MFTTTTVLATVLFLGGTGSNVMPPASPESIDHFVGPVVSQPYTARQLPYAALPWDRPQDAAPAVLAAIAAADGPVVVAGLSKGAQATHAVQRALEADPTVPSSKVTFVRIGDPDGDGGLMQFIGLARKVEPTRFETINIVGEYDPFADWPDQPNPFAILNAIMAIPVHLAYGTGSADDPLTRLDEAETTVRPNGNGTNTTTHLVPTRHLPLTRPLRDVEHFLTGHSVLTDEVDKVVKPLVDAGYSRNNRPRTTGTTPRVDTTTGNKVAPKSLAQHVAEARERFAPKTPVAAVEPDPAVAAQDKPAATGTPDSPSDQGGQAGDNAA